MIRNLLPISGFPFASPALGVALGLAMLAGSASGALAAKPPKPETPKISLSKTFQPLAQNVSKAIEAAKTRADVVAAVNGVNAANTALQNARGEARKQATANLDAALAALGNTLAAEKTQLEGAFAGATSPDDTYMAGNLGGEPWRSGQGYTHAAPRP